MNHPPRGTYQSRSRERIRSGFGRWPLNRQYLPNDKEFVIHPFFAAFEDDDDEDDDPFTPIVVSNDSGCTVCSGITMDEALVESAKYRPQQELVLHVEEEAEETPPLLETTTTTCTRKVPLYRYGENDEDDPCHHDAPDEVQSAPPVVRHTNLVTPYALITSPHNIQERRAIQHSNKLDAVMNNLGWGNVQDVKPGAPITSFRTESTIESSDDEEEEPEPEKPFLFRDTSGFLVEQQAQGPAPLKRTVSIKLEDFDIDHLTVFEDSIFDNLSNDSDEQSLGEGEYYIIRKLEANATDLYWLQLTTALTDSERLAEAMKGNTSVRNATVYPSAIESLPLTEQMEVVSAICQLKNLKNLIVFQDCGSLFVDPLIRYRPPLTRLTLYKLDVSGSNLFSKLVMLLIGLKGLEELSLEKYKGDNGCRLLKAVAKVLPNMKCLKSLTLTPARGVKLTTEGPYTLFRALWQNRTIQTLSLQGSADGIDQTCIAELANCLRANKTLEEVKLTGFWKNEDAFWKRFTPKSTKRINYFLGLNKAGIRHLQLDVNTDFHTLKSVIISQADNLDHVFYLLQQNPSIVNAG
ncbi:expressed unknown protein [Seminavis robusta]|uniref:Uncharacterized protein n=1 Tax=Seminavis robusta TaxID=568900 RepID=A0A9N8ENN8_9STRA|nr:expressed unknown protein [Seminavis robusta]|eukprot:Sro1441_g272950.1 n/a (578) ;mRNA; f:16862-18682